MSAQAARPPIPNQRPTVAVPLLISPGSLSISLRADTAKTIANTENTIGITNRPNIPNTREAVALLLFRPGTSASGPADAWGGGRGASCSVQLDPSQYRSVLGDNGSSYQSGGG